MGCCKRDVGPDELIREAAVHDVEVREEKEIDRARFWLID